MHKLLVVLALSVPLGALVACSDDDGSDVVPNPPPGAGAGGGGAAASDAGVGGNAGLAGAAGRGGGGSGGSAGAPGCTPVPPDAGADATDAGALDGGPSDAGGDGGDVLDDASVARRDLVSFATDIHPIFEMACGPCHVELEYGGHNVGGELDRAYQQAVALGQTLVTRIAGGGMPPPNAAPPNDCGAQGRGSEPGDQGCLTVAEVALVQAWIDQCFPR
jgi:hypothetical protein